MDHHDRADELEREAEAAGEASEKLEQDLEEARSDWEAKKSDQSTPGAVDAEAAGPHHLKGEDPATGDEKSEERQAEVEDAAQSEAEAEDDSEET